MSPESLESALFNFGRSLFILDGFSFIPIAWVMKRQFEHCVYTIITDITFVTVVMALFPCHGIDGLILFELKRNGVGRYLN